MAYFRKRPLRVEKNATEHAQLQLSPLPQCLGNYPHGQQLTAPGYCAEGLWPTHDDLQPLEPSEGNWTFADLIDKGHKLGRLMINTTHLKTNRMAACLHRKRLSKPSAGVLHISASMSASDCAPYHNYYNITTD